MIRRLLIRPGAIGDFIVSLPALESLRTDYTEVWCAGQNTALARFADHAQSIVASGLDGLGLLPSEHVVERLRSFDSVISWYGSNRPEFQVLVRDLGLPFEFLPALPEGRSHAVEFYNGQARSLGAKHPSRFPSIECPPAERIFAVIHPFASQEAKRAPISVFERIARKLSGNMPVHWLRGPEENLEGAVAIEDLYELGCWLRRARIFIGNDSGISHLAAAVGTPVMALFPASFRISNPKIWAPRGPSVHVVHF